MSLLSSGTSVVGSSAVEKADMPPKLAAQLFLRIGAVSLTFSALAVGALAIYQNRIPLQLTRFTFDNLILGVCLLANVTTAAALLYASRRTGLSERARYVAERKTQGLVRQLETILEQIPAGVAVIDRQQNLVMRNTRYDEFLRGARSEGQGRHAGFDARDTSGRLYTAERWPSSRAMNSGEVVRNEDIQLVYPDGSQCWLSVSAAPIADSEGSLDGAVMVFTEVTDRVEESEQRTRAMRSIMEVQERERLRIARELHDDLGQQLTVLDLQLKHVRDRSLDEQTAEELQRVSRIVDGLMEKLRDLTGSLRPLALDDFGLSSALTDLASLWSNNLPLTVDLHVDDLVDLGKEDALVVFRVVQEALTNIARHADASSVSITVQHLNDTVRIIIEDNGRGFNVEASEHDGRHFGLAGMRERLSMVGGTLEIETEPGNGTRIVGSIPTKEAT